MAGRLLVLLLPVAEIALLVTVGRRLGFGPTVALLAAAALLGMWTARRAGTVAWRRVRTHLAQGQPPGPDLLDGLVVLASAVLLVVPGFLSDAVAVAGLFPPTRALVRRALVRRFARGLQTGAIRVATVGGSMGRPFGATPHAGPAVGTDPFAGEIEDAEIIDDGRPRQQIR